MQEQTFDGTYKEPKKLTPKSMMDALKRINNGSTKRLLIFAMKDEHGRPTKEMKRAWRRFNKSKKL